MTVLLSQKKELRHGKLPWAHLLLLGVSLITTHKKSHTKSLTVKLLQSLPLTHPWSYPQSHSVEISLEDCISFFVFFFPDLKKVNILRFQSYLILFKH